MTSKISLVFLVTFTIEISFGIGVSTQPRKMVSSESKIRTVLVNISQLIDLITLKETLILCNKSQFRYCFYRESYLYNLALQEFGQELKNSLQHYYFTIKDDCRHLVHEIYRCVKENYILMDQVRNTIYLQRPDSVEEKLKETLRHKKEGLTLNFMLIDRNFAKIRKLAHSSFQIEKLRKIEEKYATKIKNIKSASIQFITAIKRCMNI